MDEVPYRRHVGEQLCLLEHSLLGRRRSLNRGPSCSSRSGQLAGALRSSLYEVDTSHGFELCPADVCAVDGAFCPTGEEPAPAPRFRILEAFDDPLLEHDAHFLAANSIEVAGIEFIRRTDGTSVTYDVNTNTTTPKRRPLPGATG